MPVGLLLAGGRGSRFDASGQRDKLLAVIDGEPVAVRAARCLASVCAQSFAVLPPGKAALQGQLRDAGCEPLVSDTTRLGMGHSIAHGAAHILARFGARALIVALGDMPHLRPATLRALIDQLGDDPLAIVAPIFQGQRGHPVVFGAGHLRALTQLTGDRGAFAILEHHRPRLIEVDDPGVLHDIDTPDDLGSHVAPSGADRT